MLPRREINLASYLILLLGVAQLGVCQIGKIYFMDDQLACLYFRSTKNLECRDLASTSQENKLRFTLDDYVKHFAMPFQLTNKSRKVMVNGLVWEQYGNHWAITRGEGQRLEITDL